MQQNELWTKSWMLGTERRANKYAN
jgi:hypothetical protein